MFIDLHIFIYIVLLIRCVKSKINYICPQRYIINDDMLFWDILNLG